MKKIGSRLFLITLFILNIIVISLMGRATIQIGDLIENLENTVEIYEMKNEERLHSLFNATMANIEANISIIKAQMNIRKQLEDLKIELAENQRKIRKINVTDIDKFKEANLIIYNETNTTVVSGTYVKVKNNYYVLTCAHLIKEDTDKIYVITDDNVLYPAELEKIDKKKDLALLNVPALKDIFYLEISEEYPKEGSEILVIGNPKTLTDAITDGTITKITKYTYLFTNKIAPGSSGGAVIYKGKLIGVTSCIRFYSFVLFINVNYGESSNLRAIKEFLLYLKPKTQKRIVNNNTNLKTYLDEETLNKLRDSLLNDNIFKIR